MASTYANLQAFLDSCPQNDPYTPIIRRDFRITRDQVAVGDIPCTEPYTQMDPTQVTDELSVLQTLRFMYYMDMGRSGYLPWTTLRLYDWVKSRVSGVNISTPMVGGECCLVINNLTYISVGSLAAIAAADGTSVAVQAYYRQTADGQAASVGLFAHEARHTEGNGYWHVSGCPEFPTTVGCDETYDETNLSPYGIQYYLAKQMLTGGINLGYSCDPTTQAQLGAAFQSLANVYPGRFVTNPPPSLSLPAAPGGACIPASTFTLNSAPSQVSGAGGSLVLGIGASNAQAGWTADSTVPWITPTAGMNSVGSGQAVFSVSPNPDGSARAGTVIAAGVAVSVACASNCTVSTATIIAFGPLSNVTIGSAPFTIGAAASSGLPVSFASTTPAICTVSGPTVTIVGTGTCSITATQAGNAIYSAAMPVTQNFTITGGTSQTIAFGALRKETLGVAPFTISAAASSGLPVSFASTTALVCSVSGSTVTVVSVGTCSIMASQAGNATYAAASSVIQSFPVITASQLIWTLNATFADGGTAAGFFTLDPDGKTFSNWDVSTTGGNASVFFPFEFTPAGSLLSFLSNDPTGLTIAFQSFASFPDPLVGMSEQLDLFADLASPLEGAGGTINISPGAVGESGAISEFSEECLDCHPSRFITSGAVSPGYQVPYIAPGGTVPVYSPVNTIQPGEWVSIYGTNLASSTATWNGDFPTLLGGTSVTIDGTAAYLWYVSPGQINLQAPDDAATGPVPVVVTTSSGTFTSTVTLAQFAPSFLLLDSRHVTGIILRSNVSGAYGGGTYDILGPTGTSLGYPTVAAKAGDIVELFGTGLGPTNPAVLAGQAFTGAAPTTHPVNLLINNVSVTPMWAGLSGAGLYQINLTVPAGLGTGDQALLAIVGGVQTQSGVVVSLQ